TNISSRVRPTRAASWACGASATAGFISTPDSTCLPPCTRGAASIDRTVPGHSLRALSRLAQSAGVLPHAAGRAAERAGDLPHVLARARRPLVAEGPSIRTQAGAADQGVFRDAGSCGVLARAVVRSGSDDERVAEAVLFAAHAQDLRSGRRGAR